MNSGLKEQLIHQIDIALAFTQANMIDENGNYMASKALYETFITMALAAIERSTGADSVYTNQARYIIQRRERVSNPDWSTLTGTLVGILKAVRESIDMGFLNQTSDVIHASVFADFLEMAEHLLEEGYKDAAAVIAGSSLESHLRHLCVRNSVTLSKASRMNDDLVKAGVYQRGDQKSVTAWLDLRNDAAHGHYEKYGAEKVGLLIMGVRDFINRT